MSELRRTQGLYQEGKVEEKKVTKNGGWAEEKEALRNRDGVAWMRMGTLGWGKGNISKMCDIFLEYGTQSCTTTIYKLVHSQRLLLSAYQLEDKLHTTVFSFTLHEKWIYMQCIRQGLCYSDSLILYPIKKWKPLQMAPIYLETHQIPHFSKLSSLLQHFPVKQLLLVVFSSL